MLIEKKTIWSFSEQINIFLKYYLLLKLIIKQPNTFLIFLHRSCNVYRKTYF